MSEDLTPALPWKPALATVKIRAIAASETMTLGLTRHARTRLEERGLIVSDVLQVLRNGYVHKQAETDTMNQSFKYQVEGRSPNSGSRSLRVVVVPDHMKLQLTVITVMWRDES